MAVRQPLVAGIVALVVVLICASGGCGNGGDGSGFGLGDTSSSGSGGSSGGSGSGSDDSGASSSGGSGSSSGFGMFGDDSGTPAAACTGGGLHCYVPTGCTTTISGNVYDPAGRVPLYNVVVFVPNDPTGKVPPIKTGTNTCNTCDVSIGDYVSVAVSDAKGHFVLQGVPATTHVPLVVQTGKWRREVFLNTVTACKDNPVTAQQSRLPQSRKDGVVADLPQMLLLTGGCDDLGCFMKSMGIADSEFSAPKGGGRLDVYSGVGGAGLSTGTAGAWGNPVFTKQAYEYYDLAIFSCECMEHNESAAGRQALHDWLGEGGKVFASHYHYTWFQQGPADFQGVATWLGGSVALGVGNFAIDTGFPKGKTFQQWLNNVGAATGNTIALNSVANSVSSVNAPTTRWIYDNSNSDTKYLSFLTPIGGIPGSASNDGGTGPDGSVEMSTPSYCGKAVFTDLHTSSSLFSTVTGIPQGCDGAALTAQQKALEFLFFDLSACVAPDTAPPPAPPPPVPQ